MKINNLSSKRDIVLEYRLNHDLYSGDHKDEIIEPQVDHIVESQLLGHAIAMTVRDEAHLSKILKPIKDIINVNDNYNVTHGTINKSKGQLFKAFLTEKLYEGYPIRSIINAGNYKCNNYIENIVKEMEKAYLTIKDNIENCRRSDGHVLNGDFKSVAENLEILFEKMDLNPKDKVSIKTRSKSKKK